MDDAGVALGVVLEGVVGLVVGLVLGGVVGLVGFGVVGAGVVLGFGVAGFGVVGFPVVGFIGGVDGFVDESVVVGVVGVVGGFVVGLVIGVPLFMVPLESRMLLCMPVESRMPCIPVESRIPRMPRRMPFRARIPRRPRIVLSLDIVPLMELLMLELLPIALELPERASDMLGRLSPELKPIFIASTSACVSPVTLYFVLHVAIACRVVASMRPVTCFTPQPSSRSCCCSASSSTWGMPLCAMAGAAQQQRAASAATERNVIATSRGGGSCASVRNPCGIATSGPSP